MNDPNLILMATTEFTRLAELPEQTGVSEEPGKHRALRKLRIRLLAEEFAEYLYQGEGANIDIGDAGAGAEVAFYGPPDPVEIADGLADILVIAWGTLLTYFGEQAATEVCREVWTSNLSKVDGSLGPIQRRDDGKLLKPEGWKPPDVRGVLSRHGFIA